MTPFRGLWEVEIKWNEWIPKSWKARRKYFNTAFQRLRILLDVYELRPHITNLKQWWGWRQNSFKNMYWPNDLYAHPVPVRQMFLAAIVYGAQSKYTHIMISRIENINICNFDHLLVHDSKKIWLILICLILFWVSLHD